MKAYRISLGVAVCVLIASGSSALAAPPPVSIGFDLVDGQSADLFTWTGNIGPLSLDFAGGTWDITASPTAWDRDDNGFSYWWETSVPGASFYASDGGSQYLQGTGTLTMTIYASDSTYTGVDDFGMHTIGITGTFSDGVLTGEPPIVGGTFSTFPGTIEGTTLGANSGDPWVLGGTRFGTFGSPALNGDAQPTPEPCTIVLLLAGGALAGGLRRRKR